MLRLKILLSKLFETKEKRLKRKTDGVINLLKKINGEYTDLQPIMTPTGDLLLGDINHNYHPVIMIKGDDYGFNYIVVYNKIDSRNKFEAELATVIKQTLNVTEELEEYLAFDMRNKTILLGETAKEYFGPQRTTRQGASIKNSIN